MDYPINKIITNQYTSGGDFVYKSDNTTYTGNYWIIGSNYYTDSIPTTGSLEIIKYINISNTGSLVKSIPASNNSVQYVARNLNNYPITYKYIDETTYERLNNIKGWQVIIIPQGLTADSTSLNSYSGLKEFLKLT